MIVEVVQGEATDPAKVHQLLDRWAVDVAPNAPVGASLLPASLPTAGSSQ